jgi:hypothetical protein
MPCAAARGKSRVSDGEQARERAPSVVTHGHGELPVGSASAAVRTQELASGAHTAPPGAGGLKLDGEMTERPAASETAETVRILTTRLKGHYAE